MTDVTPKTLSNTQKAVNELRKLIFRGELAAGSNHLEGDLAMRFGMSRTPVREAALILESQGLLELQQRRGLRILPVSTRDMSEVYDVLAELESLAAEQAAKRQYSDRELQGLADAINDMDEALDRDDLEYWAEADDRFHLELARLGGNSRVLAIVNTMSDQVRRVRAMTLYIRPVPTKSNEDHRRLLNAIRRNEPEEARRIHRAHRRMAGRMLIGLLERLHLGSV